MKNNYLCMLFFLLIGQLLWSQQKISGIVTESNGQPLIGVSVVVAQSTQGTQTDLDGTFKMEVSDNSILEFSYVGFETQRIPVKSQTYFSIVLQQESSSLSEVVITALGIKKEKKALGYAVQEVDGKALEKAKEPNVMSALTGKVAGLTVKNSTDFFGDPDLNLRGAKPLIVIDGIPDRNADLWKVNSDNVASISVLKGATASALYGSVGRNGAIMITTKKGAQGAFTVTVNNSTLFQSSFIRVPKVQREYGNGNQGVYAYIDGSGAGTEGGGWIWGPRLDQRDPSTPSGFVETPQYNSPVDPSTGKLVPLPYISRGRDNIENFFRTGLTQSNNVSLDWGSDKASFRLSMANIYQKGITPNTDLNNTSFALGGTLNPSDRFSISSSLTYNKQQTDNFPEVGYGPTNYLYNLLLWTGGDVDIRDLKNYWRPGEEGKQQRHYNISYYNNPYFQAYEYLRGYDKNNVFGNYNMEYKITSNLSAKASGGVNVYSLGRTYKEPMSYIGYGDKSRGNFKVTNENYFDILTDLGLKYKNQLTENIGLSGEVAYSHFSSQFTQSAASTDGLSVPGFYNLSNNAGPAIIGSNRQELQSTRSFYGFVDFDFYSAFFLSLTGRSDRVSTLPKENNTFFYPSISGSLVLSSLTDLPQWVSFAKLRGSWSRVSEGQIGTDPYSHIQGYEQGTSWNGTPSTQFGKNLLSSQLKPETSDTWEVGAQFRFLGSRIGLDLAYYQAKDYNNLIFNTISDATGYKSILLNGDVFKRKGLELVLDGTVIRSTDFRWDAQINLSQFRRYQQEIYGGKAQTDQQLRVGDRTDKLFANIYQTDAQGNIVYENGYPVNDPYKRFIGNGEPDWIYGWSNTFTYKNFSLNLLFDGRIGGLMYSTTNQKMWWGGLHPESINSYRDQANEGKGTYVGQGVKVVGGSVSYDTQGNVVHDDRTYASNDVGVNYNNFMQTTSNAHNHNYHYYKQTYIKLRELTLTYQFGKEFLARTAFSDLSCSLVGRNLWLSSKLPNADPDSGVDNLQTPSSRSIGFNINAKF